MFRQEGQALKALECKRQTITNTIHPTGRFIQDNSSKEAGARGQTLEDDRARCITNKPNSKTVLKIF